MQSRIYASLTDVLGRVSTSCIIHVIGMLRHTSSLSRCLRQLTLRYIVRAAEIISPTPKKQNP